jgi:tyrosinase
MITKHTTRALELPALDAGDAYRADLVFYGVDHSGPSYEARVYLNNPGADENTARDPDLGYAGSYTVFGHNGCYGDQGHCAPENMYRDEFDQRLPHPIIPWTKAVIATDAINRAIENTDVVDVTVTVVAVVPSDTVAETTTEPHPFASVRLLTYQEDGPTTTSDD